MKQAFFRYLALLSAAILMVLCTGCNSTKSTENRPISSDALYTPGVTQVRTPSSPGTNTLEEGILRLDFSNCNQGYFTALLSEERKINLQLIGPDDITYKYFIEISGSETAFPFTAGNGTYMVLAFECIGDDQYTPLLSYSLDVQLDNEFLPFLYPNQYVYFTEENKAVALAAELSADQETDLDALAAIYDYVTANISYDDEKAATVASGYLPDIDTTLALGTGICFDYAALSVAMLRALSIPARLNIGYSQDVRHAWIDVYIQSVGWVEKVIEFKGNQWHIMDPTFASAYDDVSQAEKFIGDGENYIVEYVR